MWQNAWSEYIFNKYEYVDAWHIFDENKYYSMIIALIRHVVNFATQMEQFPQTQ